MKGAVKKVMRRFHPGFSEMDIAAILAEYRIYHTPNYVYLKGEGRLLCPGESAPDTDASSLRLSLLRQGVGISGEDIKKIKIKIQPASKELSP